MMQLFVVQRVCRQWADCLSSSVKLQEKMLLRLSSAPPSYWTLRTEEHENNWPTFPATVPAEFVPSSSQVTNSVAGSEKVQAATLHPLLAQSLWRAASNVSDRRQRYGMETIDYYSTLADRKRCDGPLPDVSMQITNPPCKKVFVSGYDIELNTKPQTWVYFDEICAINSSTGVTFKQLTGNLMNDVRRYWIRTGNGSSRESTRSLSAIISELQDISVKNRHIIGEVCLTLYFQDQVFPSAEEWEEVTGRAGGRNSRAVSSDRTGMEQA